MIKLVEGHNLSSSDPANSFLPLDPLLYKHHFPVLPQLVFPGDPHTPRNSLVLKIRTVDCVTVDSAVAQMKMLLGEDFALCGFETVILKFLIDNPKDPHSTSNAAKARTFCPKWAVASIVRVLYLSYARECHLGGGIYFNEDDAYYLRFSPRSYNKPGLERMDYL